MYVFSAATGVFVRSWGSCFIATVHGLRVQPASVSADGRTYVWVADIGDHTVKQCTTDGALVLALGTAGSNGTGTDPIQFDHVADVAFGADGRVYVSDGDGGENHRVVAFVPPAYGVGWVFGRSGTSNNDFASPHSVAVDQLQRLWVADRDNNRTQLFALTPGSNDAPMYLSTWHCFRDAVSYA